MGLIVRIALLIVCAASAAAIDPQSLAAAAAYSKHQRGAALLVIQNGKTLLEEYPDGEGPGAARRIYSGTKAFWNLAALGAAEDGLLNLDEPIAKTITTWQADPRKSRITIRQLLDFSAGLEPAFYIQNTQAIDRDSIALSCRVLGEPGTLFTYGPSGLQVFYEALKAKLKGESPTHFLERRVLSRLGFGTQRYLPDRRGNPLLATGFAFSARQWAKVGRLVLADGSPVVSPAMLAQTWRGSPANRAFAFGWWNNRAAPSGVEVDFERALDRKSQNWNGACLCRDAPSDLVACIGSLGQRLYVSASLELLVVRQANGGSFSDAQFLRLLLGRARQE
ncbi:MAG: serine hydrolase domain-containing protein [Chthoniobacterales bacterium]